MPFCTNYTSCGPEFVCCRGSTASEYGFEQYPRMGWGQVLGDFYGEGMTVVDLAQSGRSARSFIDEGFFCRP